MVRGKKKKLIALFIGISALFAGAVSWLIKPLDSTIAPARILSSVALVESEDSVAQKVEKKIAREHKEGAAAVGRARVFACDRSSEEGDYVLTPEDVQKSLDSWDRLRVQVAQSLTHSENPEHLLLVALFGSGGEEKLSLSAMERALAADPDNSLTLWSFLASCSLHPEAAVCADGSIEKRAILADGNNGQLWGEIAGYRFERGDTAGAYDALTKANTAPQFNSYFIEYVELVERGLAASTDASYLERSIAASGIAAALVSKISPVLQGCKQQAAESAEWRQTCLEYGKRLENDGRSVWSTMFGTSLQKKMYEISGDTTKIAEANFRYQLIMDTVASINSQDGFVLLFDEQVSADYMKEWSAHGEFRAMQFLQAEVVRLSQQPGYDPCKLKEARKSAANDWAQES